MSSAEGKTWEINQPMRTHWLSEGQASFSTQKYSQSSSPTHPHSSNSHPDTSFHTQFRVNLKSNCLTYIPTVCRALRLFYYLRSNWPVHIWHLEPQIIASKYKKKIGHSAASLCVSKIQLCTNSRPSKIPFAGPFLPTKLAKISLSDYSNPGVWSPEGGYNPQGRRVLPPGLVIMTWASGA